MPKVVDPVRLDSDLTRPTLGGRAAGMPKVVDPIRLDSYLTRPKLGGEVAGVPKVAIGEGRGFYFG